MSAVKYSGLVRAQYGAPGPASGVTYDVDVMLPDGGVLNRLGVIPSGIRPPEEIDIAPIATFHKVVDVWNINENWYYQIPEYPHTAECSAPPAPLIDRIVSALGQATAAQKAVIRSALGVQVV